MTIRHKTSLLGFIGTAAVGFAVVSTATEAEARPNTKAYSCPALKNTISRRGAIVMNYKGNSVYKRFVSDRRFCDYDDEIGYQSVPSKSGKCRVKYCQPRLNDYGGSRIVRPFN